MKKSIALILIFCTFISITACSNPNDAKPAKLPALSFSLIHDSREVNSAGHIEYWRIVNNLDVNVTAIGYTVCYCDENNTIVDTDSRYFEITLLPGQGIDKHSCTDKSYSTSYISNYEYTINGNRIKVDCVSTNIAIVEEQIAQNTFPPAPENPPYENGSFTFTAETFYETFSSTLPKGYMLADKVVSNPFRDDRLQIAIQNEDGENTGLVVLFNTKRTNDAMSKIALTAGVTNEVDDFAILTDWYVSAILPILSDTEHSKKVNDFVEMFKSGKAGFNGISSGEYTLLMTLEEESLGDQYYITISIE